MKLNRNIAVLAATSLVALAQPAGAAKMIGYWENWGSIPLGSVSPNYDIIDLAFALPGGTDNATVSWSQYVESDSQFKADVKTLHANGKKVVLSIGGATAANLKLLNSTDVNAFVSSVESIVDSNGLDGIDLDLENATLNLNSGDNDFTNPTTPTIKNLIVALNALEAHYGSNMLITYAPETVDIDAYGSYGSIYGSYLPVIYACRNYPQIVAVQCYDSGSQYGVNGGIYYEGNPDFDVAESELLIHSYKLGNGQTWPGIPASQVAFGVPATSNAADAASYMAPAKVLQAYLYLSAGTSYGGSYKLAGGPYPDFAGVMTWDLNYDQKNGYALADTLAPYLHATGTAPGTPAILSATAGDATATLTWSVPSGTVASYNVYRGTTSGGESATPYRSGITTTTFKDTGLTDGKTYYYKVAAVNSAGVSSLSSEAAVTPQATVTVPAVPTGVKAAAGDTTATVTWNAVSGATSYTVYRGTAPGAERAAAWKTGITKPLFTNTGLTNGTTYYYKVTAVNAAGESAKSTEVSVTPQATVTVPAVPTGVKAAAGDTTATVTWNAVSGATSYTVYRGTSPGNERAAAWKTGITKPLFTNTGLTNGTTYYYKVTAVNSAGESAKSAEVSVTPVASTVPNWAPGVAYTVGQDVMYNGVEYHCLQAHTSEVGWEPATTPALWAAGA